MTTTPALAESQQGEQMRILALSLAIALSGCALNLLTKNPACTMNCNAGHH